MKQIEGKKKVEEEDAYQALEVVTAWILQDSDRAREIAKTIIPRVIDQYKGKLETAMTVILLHRMNRLTKILGMTDVLVDRVQSQVVEGTATNSELLRALSILDDSVNSTLGQTRASIDKGNELSGIGSALRESDPDEPVIDIGPQGRDVVRGFLEEVIDDWEEELGSE